MGTVPPLIAEESESQFAFILWVEGPAAGDGRVWDFPQREEVGKSEQAPGVC